MRLRIENLGPIKIADLELGDITVIFGPPNTGKSYTLKALYASTLMLDEVARELELEKILEEVARRLMRPSLKNAFQALTILSVSTYLNLKSDIVQTFIKSFKKATGIEIVNWRVKNGRISVSLEDKVHINLSDILVTRINTLWNILPLKRNTRVEIEDLLPTQKIPEVISKNLQQPYAFQREFRDESEGINLRFNALLDLKPKGEMKITTKIALSCNIKNPILERRLKKMERMAERLLSSKKELNAISNYLLRHPYFDDIYFYLCLRFGFLERRGILEPFHEIIRFIQELIGKSLETAYSESLGLRAIRFIPFGRSPIICQLEYLSKEPFQRTRKFMQTLYGSDTLLYSYISWLSRGRAKIAEREYDEEVISLFGPVLQGKLVYDKTQGLLYKRLKSVPIKWASALAGEVTGILLPILTAPSMSGIIVEEPESQLHYSAQVLMALALAGLSSEFNHKLVLSTHSDLFALVLAYIKKFKPSEEKIMMLAKEMLKIRELSIRSSPLKSLAKFASEAKKLNIKFYYYEPTKEGVKVFEKSASEMIKKVSSLTEVIEKFASWTLNLKGGGLGEDGCMV